MNMEYSILIIDDDPDDCLLIEESLYQAGWKHTVNTSVGGVEALSFLATQRTQGTLPLAVILDMNMPAMNGLEVLTKLKELYANIPVLLYSTSCTDDLIKRSKELGAYDCVKKGTSYSDNVKFARKVLELVKG